MDPKCAVCGGNEYLDTCDMCGKDVCLRCRREVLMEVKAFPKGQLYYDVETPIYGLVCEECYSKMMEQLKRDYPKMVCGVEDEVL
jgi:hypothetical protein